MLTLLHLSQRGTNLTTIRVSEVHAEGLQIFLLNKKYTAHLFSEEAKIKGESILKNLKGDELSRRIDLDTAIKYLEDDLVEWEANELSKCGSV